MHDFVIIGSGVSGGRIAKELVDAGANCLLLEAGKALHSETFPRNEMDFSTMMFWGGGIEMSSNGHFGFLRAKCLGGTSIVNQALIDRFDESAWDDWKSRSGIDYFNVQSNDKFYSKIEDDIPHTSIPENFYNKNARLFVRAYESKGLKWKPLIRAQSNCALEHGSDCIACLGGCIRDSKQSSLVTTLRAAFTKGLQMLSDFQVITIEEEKDAVTITGVHQGELKKVMGAKIVLAAGSFGNTQILLQSGYQKALPALGQHFSCHPQYMTYAIFDEPIDAHKGAFQAVKSADPNLRKAGYKFENVFVGPIGTAMLVPGFGTRHLNDMKKYRFMTSMEIAVRDEPSGSIAVNRAGKLIIQKSLTSQDKNRLKEGLRLMDELFLSIGAKKTIRGKQGFGLHLMGGCAIGTDGRNSVVDPEFRIHGSRRIYAADSSIFPSAPGINPSLTIMALSLRASHLMIKESGIRS